MVMMKIDDKSNVAYEKKIMKKKREND